MVVAPGGEMQVVIEDESHNRVAWLVRQPVVSYVLAALASALFIGVLVALSPSPIRWWVVGGLVTAGIGGGVVLGATTPRVDRGVLERTPDGGAIVRSKVYLLVGERASLEVPLSDVERLESETHRFEDTRWDIYPLARLWLVRLDGQREMLTSWVAPDSAINLGDALARAGRLTFQAD
jgi:hypothetical protein